MDLLFTEAEFELLLGCRPRLELVPCGIEGGRVTVPSTTAPQDRVGFGRRTKEPKRQLELALVSGCPSRKS